MASMSNIHIALKKRHRAKVQFIATVSTCSLAEAIRRCIDAAKLDDIESSPQPTKRKRKARTKPEDAAAA